MSYKLNRTDGSLLVELQDGVIDTTSSDITLVGRNYKGFGEYLNENYISLLENFASTSAPSNPISGQLWYDLSDQRLKIYNGTTFRTAGGPIVSSTQPSMSRLYYENHFFPVPPPQEQKKNLEYLVKKNISFKKIKGMALQ